MPLLSTSQCFTHALGEVPGGRGQSTVHCTDWDTKNWAWTFRSVKKTQELSLGLLNARAYSVATVLQGK